MKTEDQMTPDQMRLIQAIVEMNFQEAIRAQDRESDAAMMLWTKLHAATDPHDKEVLGEQALHQSAFSAILKGIIRFRWPQAAFEWFGPERE